MAGQISPANFDALRRKELRQAFLGIWVLPFVYLVQWGLFAWVPDLDPEGTAIEVATFGFTMLLLVGGRLVGYLIALGFFARLLWHAPAYWRMGPQTFLEWLAII